MHDSRRWLSPRPFGWALITAVAPACNTEEPPAIASRTETRSDAGPDAPLDPAVAIALPWVEAQCEVRRTCCGRGGYDPAALASCESDLFEQVPFLRGVARGLTVIDETQLDGCVESLRAMADACTAPEGAGSACEHLWSGTRGEGEPCEDVSECARGDDPALCLRDLDPLGNVTGGTCLAMIRGARGEACVGSNYEGYYGATYAAAVVTQALVYCDARDNLYCDLGRGICVDYAALEAPCADVACADGLYCEDVCRPRGRAGDACSGPDACALPLVCSAGVCAEPPVASVSVCGAN